MCVGREGKSWYDGFPDLSDRELIAMDGKAYGVGVVMHEL